MNIYKQIGLTQGSKLFKLEIIISKERGSIKANQRKTFSDILAKFKQKSSISTGELAKSLNFDRTFLLKRLIRMEKQGLIEKAGRIALNRAYIWKVNGR